MSKETITFRLDSSKRKAINEIASILDRDRSYILKLAIESYLEVYSWQVEHIQEGLHQADNGEFATKEEVATAFAKWRK